VLVEFSLVFVLFAFICYALVAFGLAMNLKSNLTHAASEGARTAVGAAPAGGDATCVPDPGTPCRDAKELATRTRITEAVGGQSDEVKAEVARLLTDPANAHIDYCAGTSGPYCMFVSLPFDYGHHPIVPSSPGLGIVLPDTLRAAATVQLTN
jgi:hypothetical protein